MTVAGCSILFTKGGLYILCTYDDIACQILGLIYRHLMVGYVEDTLACATGQSPPRL